MKFNQIKITLFFILLFFSGSSFAAPAEAEFIKLNETRTLRTDGSQEYRRYQELTLFTHTAMNGTYGESFITYNPEYQEIKIHDSFTRQKDGTIVRTPENAFVEVLPKAAAGAPAYNHLKEMVIVHTGLELGATIVLDYSILSRPGAQPEIDVCSSLRQTSPVKEYTLTFILPSSKTVNFESLNIKAQPRVTNTPDGKQLQWTFRNLPASSKVPEVTLQSGTPGLLFSTYPTAAKSLETLYSQFDTQNSPEVAAKANELTKYCTTETQKLLSILDFVADDIDNCALSTEATGYRLRPAGVVLKTAYGTEAEKINLLSALLTAVSLSAEPAAAYEVNASPDHCGLNAISEFVVIARADTKEYRLNPHRKSMAAVDCSLLLSLKDGHQISVDPVANKINYTTNLTLSADKAEGEVEAVFSNNHIPYRNTFAGELIDGIRTPQTQDNGTTTSVRGDISTATQKTNDYVLLTLPETNKGISKFPYARYNTARQENLRLPYVTEENYTYSILIPENMEFRSPATEKKLENQVGTLLISIRSDGKTIEIHRSIQLKKQLITPADYAAFRELIISWADPNGQTLLFKI